MMMNCPASVCTRWSETPPSAESMNAAQFFLEEVERLSPERLYPEVVRLLTLLPQMPKVADWEPGKVRSFCRPQKGP